jgi:hypothetical protein
MVRAADQQARIERTLVELVDVRISHAQAAHRTSAALRRGARPFSAKAAAQGGRGRAQPGSHHPREVLLAGKAAR